MIQKILLKSKVVLSMIKKQIFTHLTFLWQKKHKQRETESQLDERLLTLTL